MNNLPVWLINVSSYVGLFALCLIVCLTGMAFVGFLARGLELFKEWRNRR
jgi:hypothetical protein